MREKERLANIARASAWNKANQERRREITRRSYQKNRDKALAACRKRYEEKKEQINECSRRWKRANRELVVEQSARRRFRLREQQNEKITKTQLAALLMRQSGRCAYCQAVLGGTKHLDHYIPLSLGGAHILDNLRWSCPSCNLHKSRKLPVEFKPSRVCNHYTLKAEPGQLVVNV